MKWKTLGAAALALSLVTGTAWAGDFAEEYPRAPAPMGQFAPLVGDWDCTLEQLQQDGSYAPRKATWKFWYILDGHALMDEWRATLPDGSPMAGINIRHYNPESKTFEARWLPTNGLEWKTYPSRFEDGQFIMTGKSTTPSGQEGDMRVTFYDMKKDTFRWKMDWSTDGGKTWTPEVVKISAKRR
ncbi:MAG: DUF1579 family protein [Acidobacteriota bacterium]